MSLLLRSQAFLVLIAVGFAGAGFTQQLEEPLSPESFDVSVLNGRLRNEAGLNVEQSRQWLESRVRTVIRSEFANSPGKPKAIGIDTEKGQNSQMTLDDSGRGVKAIDDRLLVVAPSREMQKVKEMIETFTRFGVRQIEIRTHVLRDTAEAMKSFPIQWSHVEAASQFAESASVSNVKPASYEKSHSLTAASKYIESQKPVVQADLPPPEGVTTTTWTEASSIVERATPVLFTLLTPGKYKEVLAHAKKQSTLQRVMSPSVVVFNGQVASMNNSVERPFVTGIKAIKLGPQGKEQLEFAPNVKVYHEGTTMKIRPELFDGTSVRLNCQMDLCKIRAVETLALPGVGGRGDFHVQMPEVASTQFRTCLHMPIGYTLAVSTFETDGEGVKHSVVILCHCSIRDIESAPTAER